MDETSPTERDSVSKLSRRGLLALGATLAGTSGIGMFSGTAAAHELMAFRDAFVGDDADKQGLGSKGWLFFAKDTGTVYYHNGSSWVDLGLGGGDGALVDSDDDGLLEAPDHDGIDVGQVEADSVNADNFGFGAAPHLVAEYDGSASISSNSYTYSLNGTYSMVWVIFKNFSSHVANNNGLMMRLNEDSSENYHTVGMDGSDSFGNTEIKLGGNRRDRFAGGYLTIAGTWTGTCIVRNNLLSRMDHDVIAHNKNFSSPLESITIFDSGDDPVKTDIEVMGR